jgi:hypothetical protein
MGMACSFFSAALPFSPLLIPVSSFSYDRHLSVHHERASLVVGIGFSGFGSSYNTCTDASDSGIRAAETMAQASASDLSAARIVSKFFVPVKRQGALAAYQRNFNDPSRARAICHLENDVPVSTAVEFTEAQAGILLPVVAGCFPPFSRPGALPIALHSQIFPC